MLETLELQTQQHVSAAVIWMHGLGADANDFVSIVGELDLSNCPGIRFVFPNAPTMPVTINGGYIMRSWYDIVSTDLVRREDEAGLRKSQAEIEQLIEREVARGIAPERIFLAGFSQGCAMTLQTGLRYSKQLAGMICLSGYLPLANLLEQERNHANHNTPIFMAHGLVDNVVPLQRAQQSYDLLKAAGYTIEWHDYMMPHSVCAEEVVDLGRWLRARLQSA